MIKFLRNVSYIKDWKQIGVSCDLCGEHRAIQCPECFHEFDHIDNNPVFKVS